MTKKSLNEFLQDVAECKIVDLNNVNCDNCNECCGRNVPISKWEYEKIKKHLRRNRGLVKQINSNVKLPLCNGIMDLSCPFSIDKKCSIYDIRPEICVKFHCNATKRVNLDNSELNKDMFLANLFDKNNKPILD
jgi:Fe-S-cluster containining protein